MKRLGGYLIIIVLLMVSLTQCGAQYYCYREHPVIAVMGGCGSTGSNYSPHRSNSHSRKNISRVKSSRSR
jgi:hypothetical protein